MDIHHKGQIFLKFGALHNQNWAIEKAHSEASCTPLETFPISSGFCRF